MPLVLENVNGTPVEFHTHCTTGLGPVCCVEAIKLGVTIVNTAIPPLANGSSNPSLFNVAANARALGHTTAVDEESLHAVSEHFTRIAEQEGLPPGQPVEYDYGQYLHQVPGGMYSNLRHQLEKVGLGHKFHEALEECGRVREEFAYPIMVTPLSQFVGSQAAINVIVGERYTQVTDQSILYALGLWGEEGSRLMDPEVKDKILDRPRAREAGQVGTAAAVHRRDPQGVRARPFGRRPAAALARHQGRVQRHARRRPGNAVHGQRRDRPAAKPARAQGQPRVHQQTRAETVAARVGGVMTFTAGGIP